MMIAFKLVDQDGRYISFNVDLGGKHTGNGATKNKGGKK
jgi:hypothetical protein